MNNTYFDLHESDKSFFKRFLENRLPTRVLDGGIQVCHPDSPLSSRSLNEEELKDYTSSVFADLKYDYVILPTMDETVDLDDCNTYISELKARSLIAVRPEWSIEKCEKMIRTTGFSGFYIDVCTSRSVSGKKLSLSDCCSPKQLELLDAYEKTLYVRLRNRDRLIEEDIQNLQAIYQLYPSLKIVISGFWGSKTVSEFIAGVEKFGQALNNFFYDTAFVLDPGIFEAAIDSIHHDRIIFSSGMPYQTQHNGSRENSAIPVQNSDENCTNFLYQQFKGLLDAIGNDENLKRKVFYENAESVYALPTGQGLVRGKRVTLKDVAEASGYSLRTVKKVMNGKEYVSEKVKRNILATGTELGYTKNKIASALAKNQIHKIAIIYTETSKYFFPEVRAGFESCINEYRDFGMEFEFFITKDAKSDLSAMQSKLLRELNLRNDIEGVVIHPFTSTELTNAINELADAGKPVVTFVTDAPDSKRLCYVGSGGKKSGRIAAQLMGNYIGKKGKVSIINTASTHWQSVNREKGFLDKMHESFPEIEVKEHYFKEMLTDEEYTDYVSQILENDDIKGIFSSSANVYLIGLLLKSLGKKHVTVIGFDLPEETKQLLKDGYIDIIIFQNPEMQAYESLKLLCDYILEDVKPKARSIYTDVSIMTGESF